MDAQRAIETLAAELAAENATAADHAKLKRLLTEAEALIDDAAAYTRSCRDFHLAVAEASHNRVLVTQLVSLQHVSWPTENRTLISKAGSDAKWIARIDINRAARSDGRREGTLERFFELIPVTGVVKLNGQPIAHANLVFIPEGETKSVGGTGVSGPEGKYEVAGAPGTKGLTAGTYKVVITRPLRNDGTPPPPDVAPIDSDARETLPEIYTDTEKTILRATVEPGKSVGVGAAAVR